AGEVEEEGLVGLLGGVAQDRDVDRRRLHAGRDGDRAGDGQVVAPGAGGAVRGGVFEGRWQIRCGRERDGERDVPGAAVELRDVDVGDRQARHRVVVEDRPLARRLGDDGARRVAQAQEEGLVGLVADVAHDGDGDRLADLAGGEGERAGGGQV